MSIARFTGVAFALLLGACSDCETFADGVTTWCIPKRQVLGRQVFDLPRVSSSEIGFVIGEGMSDPNRIVVTLSKIEYVCETNPGADICGSDKDAARTDPKGSAVEKVYTYQNSSWDYVERSEEGRRIIAICRAVSSRPGFGRCFTSGVVGRSAYSLIFYDDRMGGALKAREDVERQLVRWQAHVNR